MEPRRLAALGIGLVLLGLFLTAFGPFGWILLGIACLVVAGLLWLTRLLGDDGPDDQPSNLVTCPACHARESPDRETCRSCGGAL